MVDAEALPILKAMASSMLEAGIVKPTSDQIRAAMKPPFDNHVNADNKRINVNELKTALQQHAALRAVAPNKAKFALVIDGVRYYHTKSSFRGAKAGIDSVIAQAKEL